MRVLHQKQSHFVEFIFAFVPAAGNCNHHLFSSKAVEVQLQYNSEIDCTGNKLSLKASYWYKL